MQSCPNPIRYFLISEGAGSEYKSQTNFGNTVLQYYVTMQYLGVASSSQAIRSIVSPPHLVVCP